MSAEGGGRFQRERGGGVLDSLLAPDVRVASSRTVTQVPPGAPRCQVGPHRWDVSTVRYFRAVDMGHDKAAGLTDMFLQSPQSINLLLVCSGKGRKLTAETLMLSIKKKGLYHRVKLVQLTNTHY